MNTKFSDSIYTQRSTGFTLLELMIAIAITAIIGSISATVLSGMIAGHKQVKIQERALTDLERALQIIRSDIEQTAIRPLIVNLSDNDAPEIDTQQIKGDANSLEFSTYQRMPLGTKVIEQLYRVRYSLNDEKLIRESIETGLPDANQDWQSSVLLDAVESVYFSYFYSDWEETLYSIEGYPKAVKLTINTHLWKNVELVAVMGGVSQ